MNRLHIVLVMIEPPLPFGNAAARWYYVLLHGLVERGHRVTAFATCSNPDDIPRALALFPAPAFDLRCYAQPQRSGWRAKWETLRRPYSYMFGADLKSDLKATLRAGFDVLHLEQLWSGWLCRAWADRAIVHIHYLGSIDLGGIVPKTIGGWLHQRLLRRAERQLLRSYPRCSTLSPRLADAIQRINPKASVSVVPLGIDTTLYPYIRDADRPVEPVVGLIGSMDWHPTHSAAVRLLTRLWPAIKSRVPACRLKIVGRNARTALSGYLDLPDVTIQENVPEIEPHFRELSVLLYPPGRGSGMKVKVLEAMAYGVPVVTTAEGVEGLPAVDGVHAGVCEDDHGLVERTVQLLLSPTGRIQRRATARRLLEAHCGPETTVERVDRLYRKIVDGTQSKTAPHVVCEGSP